ncbi:MAG: molybdenum cofactor biosynthesis protein MoaE [Sphingomicrobium sp.]
MIAVQPDPIDAAAELARFVAGAADAGAVVSFTGVVRADNDGEVLGLKLEHYAGFTEPAIAAIGASAVERFGVIDVTIVHRVGAMAPGDLIVFVAAAAVHRRAAFDAVDYCMDRLKTEAPLWKREEHPGGGRWIEPRPADRGDRQRWEHPA